MAADSEIAELQEEIDRLKKQLKEKRDKNQDTNLKNCAQEITPLGKINIRLRKELKGHLAKVHAFDWDRESENIVSASQDGKLIIWNGRTTLKSAAIPLRSSWVMTCAFSPSGNQVACGGLDNICTIYKTAQDQGPPKITREFVHHQGYISSCVFVDENEVISVSGDSTGVLWDLQQGKMVKELLGHTSDVMKICAKPGDRNLFCTASCDRTCRIWDLRLPSPCVQMFATHEDDINSCTFHPSSSVIATASDDGTCRLYDLTADNEISVLSFESSGAKVGCTACSFSMSGRLLFVGQDDYMVVIRDTLRGDTIGRLTDHDNRISCLSVAPNGSALCTGSWDNLLRIYA